MAKSALKIGDRFSFSDGYGMVVGDNRAIMLEPKKGKSAKFVLIGEIPAAHRFVSNCPKVFNLAFDAVEAFRQSLD